ncbi:MAG TPA: MASE1 domain-containing protein, partial [Myxococcaceae bacterium]|nr:MASE1 domain-containing protein [Myxococcaceae bacterium]
MRPPSYRSHPGAVAQELPAREPGGVGFANVKESAFYFVRLAVVSALYFAAAKVGLSLSAAQGNVSSVWPPSGIAVAALLMGGARFWPAVFVGAVVITRTTDVPWLTAVGIGCGNTLEALFAAYVLRRLGRIRTDLARVRDVVAFLVLGIPLPSLLATGVGVLSLWAGGRLAGAEVLHAATVWWLGDALGILLITPTILTWRRLPHAAFVEARWLEALALGAVLVALTGFVFSHRLQPVWLVFPALTWAALRFGPRGASSASLITATVGIGLTAIGNGPFVRAGLQADLAVLQTFLAAAAMTALFLAAAMRETKEAERQRARMEVEREHAEQRRAEALHRAELEQQLMGIVSHDLRNPINAIALSAQRLRRNPTPEVVDTSAERILMAAQRATRLIRDLLDFTQVRLGVGISVNRRPVDLHALAQQMVDEVRAAHPGRTLRLRSTGNVLGEWDPDRLGQVLSNLLANAVAYGPPEMPVEVEARGGPAEVVLEVRNGGPPIPADLLPDQLFAPLQRRPHHGPNTERSIGLGLFIVRGIVKAHGG